MHPKLRIQGINCEEGRQKNRKRPNHRCSAERDDGKCKNAVGCQPEQLEHTVFWPARMACVALHEDSDLAKSHPGTQAAEISVLFWHPANFGNHATRHQAEVT